MSACLCVDVCGIVYSRTNVYGYAPSPAMRHNKDTSEQNVAMYVLEARWTLGSSGSHAVGHRPLLSRRRVQTVVG